MKNIHRSALLKVTEKFNPHQDSSTSLVRRNLLFFSVVGFYASVVDPTTTNEAHNGLAFKVNFGILSGTIDAYYVYLGAALVCFYQLRSFWLLCRNNLINRENLTYYLDSFMGYVTAEVAKTKFDLLANSIPARPRIGPEFKHGLKKQSNNSEYESQAPISTSKIRAQNESTDRTLEEAIGESANFRVHVDDNHDSTISFVYKPTLADWQYFFINRDLCWIRKSKHFWDNLIPIFLGYLTCWLLVRKTSDVYFWQFIDLIFY